MSDPVIVGVDGPASSLGAVEPAAREAHLRGVPPRIVHASGRSPSRLPSDAAPRNPAGLSGFAGLPPGSVGQALPHHAPRPVVAVRGKE
ncbi:hypothetical protein [Streptomyces sp. NPDC007264]|uniref:hypothetical protein n=1 Tax=Streptomyces sp. NPDC007264 TaxID=3364777 RepID=UPI0036DE7C48